MEMRPLTATWLNEVIFKIRVLGNVLCDKMNNYLALYNTCSLISYVSSLILNATNT